MLSTAAMQAQVPTWTVNGANMYLNPTTANVGIGKVPASNVKLDVAGNAQVRNDLILGTGNKQFILHTQMQYPNNPPILYIAPKLLNGSDWDWDKQTVFNADGSVKMNGILHAKEVRVCLSPNGGCDYVFADNYNLMSLSELSSFVKTNKHLPEVAPAAVMEADGINLSEMNALLLKKVEELTLYVLDQHEKMQILEAEIKELKNK